MRYPFTLQRAGRRIPAIPVMIALSMVLSGCSGDEGGRSDVQVVTTREQSLVRKPEPSPSPAAEAAPASIGSAEKAVPLSEPSSNAIDEELSPELTFEKAEAAYREGRYTDAAELFANYTGKKGENPWGHYMRGLSSWKAGDYQRAEEAFARALELDSLHVKSWINLSRVLLDEGKPEEALTKIEKALEIDPESGAAFRQQGRAFALLGQREEAVGAYRHAILIDDRDAWAMNNLGLLFIEEGLYFDALPPLARAVELRDDIALFQNNLGMALERTGRYRAAEEAYRSALALDRTSVKAQANLSRVEGVAEDPGIEDVDLAEAAQRFCSEIEGWREGVAGEKRSESVAEPKTAIVIGEADSTGHAREP